MFSRFKIKTRLLVAFLLAGILPMAAISLYALSTASEALTQEAYAKLEAVQKLKGRHVEGYLAQMLESLNVLKDDPTMRNALYEFENAFQSGKGVDNSGWQTYAELYDERMKDITKDFGWEDLFLFGNDGDIVYTVARKPDLGQNLIKGDLNATAFARALQQVATSSEADFIAIADYQSYAPSKGAQAAFMVAKIRGADQAVMGYIAFQIPDKSINAIVQERTGMGVTGESYLVGKVDGKTSLRSDRTVKKGKIGDAKTDALIEKALSGKSGVEMKTGSTGAKEVAAYAPIDFKGLNWSIQTTMAADEALAAVTRLRNATAIAALVAIAAIVGLALWVTGAIVRPIRSASAMLKDIAEGEGDLTKRLELNSRDELGEMAGHFNTFVANLQALIGQVSGNARDLDGAATHLSALSSQMSQGTEQMSGRAGAVAAAAEQMSANMNSVAAAMEQAATNITMVASASEQMSATVNEIAGNSEKARGITTQAVTQAESATANVNTLGEAARQIGKVVETITEISEQVNLLALNATIEAARAGEAGRGFAVVANEIKELAKQTAAASGQIKEQIAGIQDSSAGTVEQITKISNVIHGVSDIVATIATAVEEQSVTTKEIAGNVSQAAAGIAEVNGNVLQSSTVAGQIAGDIGQVNQGSDEIAGAAGQVNASAAQMAGLAAQLNGLVGRFKV